MAAVLVIGYGNPLRSDDGIGWRVAEAVRQIHTRDDRVEVLTCHQLVPELAANIAEADHVIFVDATEGATGGQVQHKDLNPAQYSGSSHHQVDPTSLLQLSREVYGRCPKACLITVSAESLSFGQQLTQHVKRGIPNAVRMVEECIEPVLSTSPASLP